MYKTDETIIQINAIEKLITYLEEGNRPYAGDLHNNVFNEDYYVIGYAEAEEDLEEYGTFEAIRKVQQYEQENFGEVSTDLGDPEKVINMLFYIIGEEVLNNLDSFTSIETELITNEQAESMIEELKTKSQEMEG